MFASLNCNFDPAGTDLHSAHGTLSNVDVFVSKFDFNGNHRWTRTWGGNGADAGSAVADNAGHLYVIGYLQIQLILTPVLVSIVLLLFRKHCKYFLSKLDTAGNLSGQKPGVAMEMIWLHSFT